MNSKSLQNQLQQVSKQILRFKVPLFVLIVLLLYLFIVWRVATLSAAEPSQSAISSQTESIKHPHIDQTTVDKIRHLQDNSVSVQTLFDQARQNPFQE